MIRKSLQDSVLEPKTEEVSVWLATCNCLSDIMVTNSHARLRLQKHVWCTCAPSVEELETNSVEELETVSVEEEKIDCNDGARHG
jgi:hypothetical protein